jgi:hypothetical protein
MLKQFAADTIDPDQFERHSRAAEIVGAEQ